MPPKAPGHYIMKYFLHRILRTADLRKAHLSNKPNSYYPTITTCIIHNQFKDIIFKHHSYMRSPFQAQFVKQSPLKPGNARTEKRQTQQTHFFAIVEGRVEDGYHCGIFFQGRRCCHRIIPQSLVLKRAYGSLDGSNLPMHLLVPLLRLS